MEPYLLNNQLERYVREKMTVVLVLHNRVQLRGRITAYDNHTLLLQGRSASLVYRHAIAQIGSAAPPVSNPELPARKSRRQRPPRPVRTSPTPKRAEPPSSQGNPPPSPQPAFEDPAGPVNEAMGRELLKWMERHQLQVDPEP